MDSKYLHDCDYVWHTLNINLSRISKIQLTLFVTLKVSELNLVLNLELNGDSAITWILVLGETSVNDHADTCVLDSVIECIISNKRFNEPLLAHSMTKFFFNRQIVY